MRTYFCAGPLAYSLANNLSGLPRHARDQLLRASQSIPLNIAEGTNADRRRFFQIAPGPAMECAAIQDWLTACKLLGTEQNTAGKTMLTPYCIHADKARWRNHELREDTWLYGNCDYDNDKEFQPGERGTGRALPLSPKPTYIPLPSPLRRKYTIHLIAI